MANITIIIEGESREIRQTLLEILGIQPQSAAVQPHDIPSEFPTTQDAEESLEWTSGLFREFWSGLNVNARRILTEIAHHPEGVGINDVKNRLGIEQNRLAGQLAPVGFAMRRLEKRYGRRPKPKPYETDYRAWVYRMDPDFAQMVLDSDEHNNP